MGCVRDEGADTWADSALDRGNSPFKSPEAGRCPVVKGTAEASPAGAECVPGERVEEEARSIAAAQQQGAMATVRTLTVTLDEKGAIGLF